MKPLVSVMMPAYNASRYISDAIVSMQAQTHKNWQLCIVDDGSQDLTLEIARTFIHTDSRICIDQIPHGGCPVARNACLKMCKGDIIAKLDADDVHEPERLERQVEFLLHHDKDIVTCNMNWLKGSVKIRKNTGHMDVNLYMLGKSNGPCCACVVAWKKVYDVVGGYAPEMKAGSDGDWNFRTIVNKMCWGHLPGYWYTQRRHPEQLSQRMHGMQRNVHEASRKKYLKIWQ